jgi:hypothetical protein
MKKAFSKIITLTVLIISLSLLFSFPALTQAAKKYDFKDASGLNTTAGEAGYDVGAQATSLNSIIGTIIYVILSLVGVLFFILVVYGAYTWMTSKGNEEKVKKANSLVMNALLGLIITLSAYALSYFLINYFL